MIDLDISFLANTYPKRKSYFSKKDLGNVIIIAGSEKYTGAGIICVKSAARSGAGLVTLATSKESVFVAKCHLLEEMCFSYDDEDRLLHLISKADSIVIGPGLDRDKGAKRVFELALENANIPIIIDADGLWHYKNYLMENEENLRGKNIILTPHEGEFSMLTGIDINLVRKNRIKLAEDYAFSREEVCLLKGKNTVITDGNHTIINPTGNSAMATGGMGDALSGTIGAFLAAGQKPIFASAFAAYIHGLCGDILAKKNHTLLARDVINIIPRVIKKVIY